MTKEFRNLHRVFVYGTLKCGQPNYQYMKDPPKGYCRFVTKALTTNNYPLVIATKWNLPFILDKPGVGLRIEGEVYEADDEFLQWADEFEVHPTLYLRDKADVDPIPEENSPKELTDPEFDRNQSLLCWIYFLKEYPEKLLQLPHYGCYNSYGSHKRPYVPCNDYSAYDNIMEALMQEIEGRKLNEPV